MLCGPDRNLNNPKCAEWLGILLQISYLHTIISFDIYPIYIVYIKLWVKSINPL